VPLALAATGVATRAAPPPCSRIVAIGDLHGGYDSLVTILDSARLISKDGRWNSPDACLVIVGDMVDRGDRSRDLLDYVMSLQEMSTGQVHVLLGNHEVMNLVGDLRYVTPGEFGAYADLETPKLRRQGYQAFLRSRAAKDLPRAERTEAFERSFPVGWFGHRRAFAPDGRYGSWLLSLPVVLKLDSTVFVHGGIEPAVAALGLDAVNDMTLGEVVDYLRLRDELVAADWLAPLVPFAAAFAVTEERLASGGEKNGAGGGVRESAMRFLELRNALFARADGPLWSRKLALDDERALAQPVAEMLRSLGAERIVAGHTTQEDHRIKARLDGRVFLIDTGAGPAYGGHPSALEIEGGVIRALYPDGAEVLAGEDAAASSAHPPESPRHEARSLPE